MGACGEGTWEQLSECEPPLGDGGTDGASTDGG
jgi:hypothetical protein